MLASLLINCAISNCIRVSGGLYGVGASGQYTPQFGVILSCCIQSVYPQFLVGVYWVGASIGSGSGGILVIHWYSPSNIRCNISTYPLGITFEMPSWHYFWNVMLASLLKCHPGITLKKITFDTGFKTYFKTGFKTGFDTGNTPGTGFNTGNTPEIPFYGRWASPCICRQYAPFHYFKRMLQVICSFPPRKRLRGVLNLSKAERAAGELR